MNESFHLYQIQKIDSQKDTAQFRISKIASEISENSELIAAQEELTISIKNFYEVNSIVNKLNDEVETKKIKIDQCNSDLYNGSVKNPKELQDLQKELSLLKDQLMNLEENELKKMIELEKIENNKNEIEKKLHTIESKVNTKNSMLIAEKKDLIENLSRLEVEREAIAIQVQPPLLSKYEKLRSERNGIAVATLQDNSCSACGAVLSPSECQSTRDSNQIFNCPTCKRILYGG